MAKDLLSSSENLPILHKASSSGVAVAVDACNICLEPFSSDDPAPRLTMTEDKNSTEEWIKSIQEAGAANMQTRKLHMRKVPEMLQANKGFQKYFVPQVVSIGPYHHGNPMLQQVQNLKPVIASKYVSNKLENFQEFHPQILRELHAKILERISEVRECYDKGSIQNYKDDSLAQMMILDGCFVLFYILCVYASSENDLGMKSVDIALARQDLFLLENQLPSFVLEDLMDERIQTKQKWMTVMRTFIRLNCVTKKQRGREQEGVGAAHLLELLRKRMVDYGRIDIPEFNRYTYHNIKELMAVGIEIKPSDSGGLTGIGFDAHGSYATLTLPSISVYSSTKSKFLNLIADEMSSDEPNELWVTSYICFVSKLIPHPDDVKMLSSAKILDNYLGSDDEVANLFHEIGGDLVPNPCAYAGVKYDIQCYYKEISSSWLTQFRRHKTKVYMSQLMDDYFKNPWSILALGGAILALFFTGVQAYFQIWSSPSECEGLCNYIKTTHRI